MSIILDMLKNPFHYMRLNFSAKSSDKLLAGLLLADALFIVVHVFMVFGGLIKNREFMLDYEGGFPEIFQYAKYVLIIILIGNLTFGRKSYSYIPWLLLFIILGLDDAIGIHERFGWQFAHRLNLDSAIGLKAIDLGEMVYSGIAGLFFLGLLSFFYLRGSGRFRKTSWDIAILFAIFLFFGIVVDMLHSFFESSPTTGLILAIVEDGGEMIALSLLAWYFYFLMNHFSENRPFLVGSFSPDRAT